ncbi:MAG: hypothetical protein HYS55_03860 [Candidatus Omnitrophica bacterium]|nr:hypothetical protein [Candidatus Omnitrophota bacterium]
MKKALLMLSLVVVMLSLGMSQAYATLPTVNGTLAAGEWDSLGPYPYYLEVFDPNEADNAFDNTDISHAVLFQELTSVSGDADFTNDGIYLLLEVYAPPPTLDWQSVGVGGIGITGTPNITMQGDLLGDGLSDGFNIFVRHFNLNPDPSIIAPDRVEVCVGSAASCLSLPPGSWADLTASGGAFGRGSVLEYYIPAGTFGTPPSPPGTPFPFSFIGTLTYDNGIGGPSTSDDVVIGTLIPEPSTIFMALTGLLGLVGAGRLKFWN